TPLGVLRHLARELAAIERPGSVPGDGAKRVRVVLVDEAIAGARHLAARQEDLRRFRILLEKAAALGNGRRQRFVEDESFVCESNRGLDELGPLHLAASVFLVE